ncbi:MAG: transporter substrate-binding domain-containing protein [Candidatus Zixiibacteriota bacterium]
MITPLLAALIVLGCSSQPEPPRRPPDHLVFGLETWRPPFAYWDSATSAPVGFDIELATLLCRSCRWSCDIVPVPAESLAVALKRGEIDVAMRVAEGETVYAQDLVLSHPYYLTGLGSNVQVVDSATKAAVERTAGRRIVDTVLSPEYYCLAMRSSDTHRLARLNDALAALMGGYVYERLHVKWFGYPPLNVAAPDSVTASWNRP